MGVVVRDSGVPCNAAGQCTFDSAPIKCDEDGRGETNSFQSMQKV